MITKIVPPSVDRYELYSCLEGESFPREWKKAGAKSIFRLSPFEKDLIRFRIMNKQLFFVRKLMTYIPNCYNVYIGNLHKCTYTTKCSQIYTPILPVA